MLKRHHKLPDFLGDAQEQMFLSFFRFIASTDHKEVKTALQILDKLMPVMELMRLEDSAKTTKNIEDVIDMSEIIRAQVKAANREETVNVDATDPDTE